MEIDIEIEREQELKCKFIFSLKQYLHSQLGKIINCFFFQ